MSALDVQRAMLDLMDAISGDIIRTEAMAEELTRAAVALAGRQLGAEAIRDTAVRKRVQALELRGRLAALQEEYSALFPLKL